MELPAGVDEFLGWDFDQQTYALENLDSTSAGKILWSLDPGLRALLLKKMDNEVNVNIMQVGRVGGGQTTRPWLHPIHPTPSTLLGHASLPPLQAMAPPPHRSPAGWHGSKPVPLPPLQAMAPPPAAALLGGMDEQRAVQVLMSMDPVRAAEVLVSMGIDMAVLKLMVGAWLAVCGGGGRLWHHPGYVCPTAHMCVCHIHHLVVMITVTVEGDAHTLCPFCPGACVCVCVCGGVNPHPSPSPSSLLPAPQPCWQNTDMEQGACAGPPSLLPAPHLAGRMLTWTKGRVPHHPHSCLPPPCWQNTDMDQGARACPPSLLPAPHLTDMEQGARASSPSLLPAPHHAGRILTWSKGRVSTSLRAWSPSRRLPWSWN